MSTPDAGSILAAFRAELATVDSPEALEDLARRHTGKKSAVKALLKGLRDVDPAERPAVAAAINETAATIEAEVEAARERIDAIALEAAVAAEWMDLSMPGTLMERGARHPLVEVEDRCLAVLARLGFEVVDDGSIPRSAELGARKRALVFLGALITALPFAAALVGAHRDRGGSP